MLEKDIENLLAQHPDEFFPGEGFKLVQQQKILGKVRADILFEDRHGRLIIVEVKRGVLSREASGQVMEYYGALKCQRQEKSIELILCANIIPAERRTFLEASGIDCKELGLSRIQEVAARFGYRFLDEKPAGERPAPSARASDIGPRVWIFQANPKRYDILNALAANALTAWLVNQNAKLISKGHTALIWMSGSNAGIYAVAGIESDPRIMRTDGKDDQFWVDDSARNIEKLRVELQVTHDLTNRPLLRTTIMNTSGLDRLTILRVRTGTNFQVKPEEWQILRGLLFGSNA